MPRAVAAKLPADVARSTQQPGRGPRATASPVKRRREAQPPARWVSQHTCFAVLGITAERYKLLCSRHSLTVMHEGQLWITRASDWDEIFDAHAVAAANDSSACDSGATYRQRALAARWLKPASGGRS